MVRYEHLVRRRFFAQYMWENGQTRCIELKMSNRLLDSLAQRQFVLVSDVWTDSPQWMEYSNEKSDIYGAKTKHADYFDS